MATHTYMCVGATTSQKGGGGGIRTRDTSHAFFGSRESIGNRLDETLSSSSPAFFFLFFKTTQKSLLVPAKKGPGGVENPGRDAKRSGDELRVEPMRDEG